MGRALVGGREACQLLPACLGEVTRERLRMQRGGQNWERRNELLIEGAVRIFYFLSVARLCLLSQKRSDEVCTGEAGCGEEREAVLGKRKCKNVVQTHLFCESSRRQIWGWLINCIPPVGQRVMGADRRHHKASESRIHFAAGEPKPWPAWP